MYCFGVKGLPKHNNWSIGYKGEEEEKNRKN